MGLGRSSAWYDRISPLNKGNIGRSDHHCKIEFQSRKKGIFRDHQPGKINKFHPKIKEILGDHQLGKIYFQPQIKEILGLGRSSVWYDIISAYSARQKSLNLRITLRRFQIMITL